jgi:GDP-L-fucose synthase
LAVNLDAKIFVAGHRGLMGSALVRRLRIAGFTNLLLRTHFELDLTNAELTKGFFAGECPEYVFLAAAKVGGILANREFPADFIRENLRIQTNVIHEAYRSNVKRLLFLGSSCVYPKYAPQPIKEEYLLTGPLEVTNRPYALAKISGIEMCSAYNRPYGTSFIAAMPTNLYGPNDNYDLQHSHVVPALIRKIYEAKINRSRRIVLWGTGTPRREFLFSDDAAEACILLMNLPPERATELTHRVDDAFPIVNIGWGADVSIRELAECIAATASLDSELVFDPSKPDGTPRKLLDITLMKSLGWQPKTSLREGIATTYREYALNTHHCSLEPPGE